MSGHRPYDFGIKLSSPRAGRDVALVVRADLVDADGFHRLGAVKVR